MLKFYLGATVVCSRNVKDPDTGEYTDPATSMKITILDPRNAIVIDNQDMEKDDTGKYHHNYNSSVDGSAGKYTATYTAIEGTEVSIEKDYFELD